MRTGTGLYEEWKDYRWTPTGLLGYMWTPCGLPQDLRGSEKYTHFRGFDCSESDGESTKFFNIVGT